MRIIRTLYLLLLSLVLLFPAYSFAQTVNFAEVQSRVLEYQRWLDVLGSNGSRYWLRLDSTKRPHQLYVGEGFKKADDFEKERFVEIFSRFLAGHPERNMLIDIFDAATGKLIGEYGFGGFKLY
jgi:hypothetical protein